MTDIIQKWIAECIGLVMNMNPDIFTLDVMDGTVLARILQSYHIITQEQFISIIPTDNPNVAFKNLKRVGLWLNANGIKCLEEDLLDISLGKSASAIKLFYQLYLALHDKDKLHYTAKKRGKERLRPNDTKFEIIPVKESTVQASSGSDHPLSEPLVVRRDIIQWNHHRYQTLLEDYDIMREKYANYIHDAYSINYRNKFTGAQQERLTFNEVNEMDKRFPEMKECTYEELMEQEKNAVQMKKFAEDPKVAKKIVNTVQQKRRRAVKQNETKLYQQRILLMELWEKLLIDQEKELDETISKKMLKQSEFEKQMVTRMFEVRQQKRTLLENRRFMDEEVMKKRETEFLESVFLREKSIGDQKYNYYFERDRTLELHKRIYAEKNRLKAERHNKICEDIAKDLVNIAIRHSEFKGIFKEDVPKSVQKQWANLFVKEQPIFDLLGEIEDITQDNRNLPRDIEEIYCIEIYRQNDLDQRDFENYLKFEWPWILEELLTDYDEIMQNITLGMNVLGQAVHQMLLAKYPMPKSPPKPDIPNVEVAVCVNGLPDFSVLPVLQKLLLNRKIKVIEIQEIINFCIEAYNNEIKTEYVDNFLISKTDIALETSKNTKAKEVPKKGAKTKEKNKGAENENWDNISYVAPFADKQCQTPIIFPCEEIVLSPKGELGKMAYDLLNTGEQLTDNLIVAMFMEYLKSLKDVNGWALINYPTTLGQAALLEEALTGVKIPGISDEVLLDSSVSIGDIADLEYRETESELEEQLVLLRKSRILPNPNPPIEEPDYETYLTAYIHAQFKSEDENLDEEEESLLHQNSGIKPEICSQELEIGLLDEFYTNQGCNYTFDYKTFDLPTLKHLAKLILGDYTLPRKNSVELFGDTVLYLEANTRETCKATGKESKSEKVEKSKKQQAEENKKNSNEGKQRQICPEIIIDNKVDKDTQIPEHYVKDTTIVESPTNLIAGDPLWTYSNLSFPDHFQIALATLWENTEDVYLCDFKELFFIKRVLLNAIVPYLTHVRQHMETFITRPDDKQTYLSRFQTIYNEIDADLRDDEELKAEIHCRIAEFREKLWETCDRRMNESEEERRRIVSDSWVTIQACELANNYINAMQLEIDRCCDTFLFIIDYYTGLIIKMPSEEVTLHKVILNRNVLSPNSDSTSFGEQVKDALSKILTTTNIYDSESVETPFHQTLTEVAVSATTAISTWKATALNALQKFENLIMKSAATKQTSTSSPAPHSGKASSEKKIEPDPEIKEALPKLAKEWNCAINGEFLRAKLRIDILTKRGELDLNDLLNYSKRIFYNLYSDISDRYEREIRSVNTACEVLAAAVEAEMPLQPELKLDGDKFYVDRNVLLFPQALPAPEPPVKEKDNSGIFTVQQLEDFRNILMNLAPNTSIPERTFVYLLQDMIVQNAEDGKEAMVPSLWIKLQPNLVSELSAELFGDVEFLDWREFIVYNLCIAFPSEHELILTREQFREYDTDITETVKDYQFFTMKLWFEHSFNEEDPQEMLRLKLIKTLLFKLYQINEETINYTALLLAFCKDADPVIGFAKALTLALGKYVCWDTTIGETFIKNLREQRYLDNQIELQRKRAHDQAVVYAESVVSAIVDKTVHTCESIIIEDYKSQEELNKNKPSDLNVELGSCHSSSDKILTELYTNEIVMSNSATKTQRIFLMDKAFSNIEIGFQPTYNPPKVYFMPFKVLLTVLTASLPWHAKAQTVNDVSTRERLEVIFASVRNSEFENNVFTHEILNNQFFKELLWSNSKFTIKNPPKIVKRLVTESCGVCCTNI